MFSLAFEIGFDHYRFNLPLDIVRFPDQYRKDVRNGFDAAKIQNVSKKKADIFEKKLLSIRDRGLVKGLIVSITVDDLRYEFKKTRGICPITGIAFTFAEHTETNWSVDRINNDLGYFSDNIVIISVVANQAKSDLDLSGIIKKSLATHQPENQLLTEKEWFRMAQFYFKKMNLSKPLNFCQLLSNTQSLFDELIFMQLFHYKCDKSQNFLKHLERYISKDVINKSAKLARKRIYHRAYIDMEVLYASPKLYCSVQSFIKVIKSHNKEFDPLLMNCLFA